MIKPFVLSPGPAATFALPNIPLPADVKDEVLRFLHEAPWERYFTVPEEVIESTPFGDFLQRGYRITFTRGAEDAVLRMVQKSPSGTLLAPRFSYPGYRRISRALGMSLVEYDDTSCIQGSDSKDAWIIVTDPGNPIDAKVRVNEACEASAGARVILDAAYSFPGSREFALQVQEASSLGVPVVFSLSKSVPLAGVRLGGVIHPRGQEPGLEQDPRFWTVLDAAIMNVFASPSMWALLEERYLRQVAVHRNLCKTLTDQGWDLVGVDSRLFATVSGDALEGSTHVKNYRGHATRVDPDWLDGGAS